MTTYTDKRPMKPLERVSIEALMERLKRDFKEYELPQEGTRQVKALHITARIKGIVSLKV